MVVDIRRLTVTEYHRMGELGILAPDEPVELIDGQIIRKPVKGTPHEAAITRTERKLRKRLDKRVLLRFQSPIHLNKYSEPKPDIAVVKLDSLDYEDHHPTPSEVYLPIEIADTSLDRDTDFKAKVYARGGIKDYWVLDIIHRQLYVFRDPSESGYQQEIILSDDGEVSLLAFPNVKIGVAEMLRPR